MKTAILILGLLACFPLAFYLDQVRAARRARREREKFDRMRSVVFPPGWDFQPRAQDEKLKAGECGQIVNGSNETTQETTRVCSQNKLFAARTSRARPSNFFAGVSKGNGAGKNR